MFASWQLDKEELVRCHGGLMFSLVAFFGHLCAEATQFGEDIKPFPLFKSVTTLLSSTIGLDTQENLGLHAIVDLKVSWFY